MIRISAQPEPPNFDLLVRRPGRKYLARYPRPTEKQFRSHSYWTRILGELHSRYNGICAYSCHWIAFDTGSKQVEHFLPKSEHPQLAYEWSNYRLVCGILNGRKGTRNVLDPFTIEDGWFIIGFPSLLVMPSASLEPEIAQQIHETIGILGLNDEGTCMKTRAKYVEDYCKRRITYDHLIEEAPFLAKELARQGYVESIRDIMLYG